MFLRRILLRLIVLLRLRVLLLVVLLRLSVLLLVVLLRLSVLLLVVLLRLRVLLLVVLLRLTVLLRIILTVGLLRRLLIHLKFSLLQNVPRVFESRLRLLHALESVRHVADKLVENLIGVAVDVLLQLLGTLPRPLHNLGFLLLRLT